MVGLAHMQAGALAEAAAWLNRALDGAATGGDEVLQARADLALACLDQHLGHDLRAWRRAERTLPILARGDDRRTLAEAHACVGRSKLAAGDAASAAWTFETALHLVAGPDGDPSFAAALYSYLGLARERLGEGPQASEALQKALEAVESVAGSEGAGARYRDSAVAAADDGRFDVAIAHAGEALAVYDTLGCRRRLADIHWRLGDIDARAERWTEAQRHYWTSIAIYGAGHVRGAAHALACVIKVLLSRAPSDAARMIGETVLALFPGDADASGAGEDDRASALWLRGTVQRLLGRIDEARAALTESLRLFERLRRPDEMKTVRRELALLAVEANDLAAAREHLAILWASPERRHVPAGP